MLREQMHEICPLFIRYMSGTQCISSKRAKSQRRSKRAKFLSPADPYYPPMVGTETAKHATGNTRATPCRRAALRSPQVLHERTQRIYIQPIRHEHLLGQKERQITGGSAKRARNVGGVLSQCGSDSGGALLLDELRDHVDLATISQARVDARAAALGAVEFARDQLVRGQPEALKGLPDIMELNGKGGEHAESHQNRDPKRQREPAVGGACGAS